MKRNKYVEFMLDPANEKKCGSCPENSNAASSTAPLPCGQLKCWVRCHCEAAGIKTKDEK